MSRRACVSNRIRSCLSSSSVTASDCGQRQGLRKLLDLRDDLVRRDRFENLAEPALAARAVLRERIILQRAALLVEVAWGALALALDREDRRCISCAQLPRERPI